MMGLAELLPVLIEFVIFGLIVALFIFALIGIHKVHSDYKESKWQKKCGDKLKEDTERNEWENIERLRDGVFLLEEVFKKRGEENKIDAINKIISAVDYDTRYNAWSKYDAKWKVFALSSMAGGFGASEKAQSDIQKDFERYEKQRRQELREKLDRQDD